MQMYTAIYSQMPCYGHPFYTDTLLMWTLSMALCVRINVIWLYCNLNKRLTCTQNNVRIMSYNIIFSQNKDRGLIIWISVVIKIILILNKIRPNKKSTIYNNHCNKIHNLIVNHWVGLLHWEESPKGLWKQ